MYILVILAVIISVLMAGATWEVGFAALYTCIDPVALILIVVIVIPAMASMGMLKDVNRAFRLTLGRKKPDSLSELKRAKLAITYFIKCTLFAGIVGTLVGGIQVLSFCKEIFPLEASLAVAFCPLLYAFVIALVLLPIEAKLDKKIVEFMESEE